MPNKWYKPSEQKPRKAYRDLSEHVLIARFGGGYTIGYYNHRTKEWRTTDTHDLLALSNFTHWQRISPVPDEELEED
jgi:hypothetical protein